MFVFSLMSQNRVFSKGVGGVGGPGFPGHLESFGRRCVREKMFRLLLEKGGDCSVRTGSRGLRIECPLVTGTT